MQAPTLLILVEERLRRFPTPIVQSLGGTSLATEVGAGVQPSLLFREILQASMASGK